MLGNVLAYASTCLHSDTQHKPGCNTASNHTWVVPTSTVQHYSICPLSSQAVKELPNDQLPGEAYLPRPQLLTFEVKASNDPAGS